MLALKEQPVIYPESDGKPMAETNDLRLLDSEGYPLPTAAEKQAQRTEQERYEKEAAIAEQKCLRKLLEAAGLNPDNNP